MPLTPLVPAARRAEPDRRWSVAASTLLHLAAVAIVIGIAARQPPPPGAGSPSFDLVFESPTPAANSAKPPGLPPIQPADIPPPDAPLGTPAPPPLSPPQPDGAASPQPGAVQSAPAPASPPPPAPAESAPPLPAPAEPPPPAAATPAAPATAPSPPPLEPAAPEPVITAEPSPQVIPQPTPPEVNLRLPARPGQSILRLDTTPIMPKPPPPLPPAPPRPRVLRRQALGTLSNPMNLSLGPAAPRPAARGSVASRAIDLSPPPEQDGPSRSDPYSQIRAANASADWNRGLLQYWLRHRFYPQQAAVNGDEGTVTIQLTVDRSGLVEDVEVISRSGSQWLDMAALATFRGAHLPPFTNEMRQSKLTFPIPITYYLLRR